MGIHVRFKSFPTMLLSESVGLVDEAMKFCPRDARPLLSSHRAGRFEIADGPGSL